MGEVRKTPRGIGLAGFFCLYLYIKPAFLSVAYAPFLMIVRSPLVETFTVIDLPSSCTNTRFFWRFGARRTFPHGLNCVARVRLLYRPPICVVLPVIWHCRAICEMQLLSAHGTIYRIFFK